jgi:hypothetical protein
LDRGGARTLGEIAIGRRGIGCTRGGASCDFGSQVASVAVNREEVTGAFYKGLLVVGEGVVFEERTKGRSYDRVVIAVCPWASEPT